jgi:phage I-like protein
MERAKDWGNRFHFDWDHHAYLTMSKGVRAPRQRRLVRARGPHGRLWATDIEWTNAGQEGRGGRARLRATCPRTSTLTKSTREVTKFNNAALTNLPALKQLEALASMTSRIQRARHQPKHEEPTMERKALLSALGLPENTTDAELAAKRGLSLNAFKRR